jgi:hypothetical protein
MIEVSDELFDIIHWAVTGVVVILFMFLIGVGLHRAGLV